MDTKTGQKTKSELEAKRQQATQPKNKETADDGSSYRIDHLTDLDNEEAPDTNFEPAEDIAERINNDLSFWGGSWTWVKTERAYGNKPEDHWLINPTPQLIGEVMRHAPLVHNSCETVLLGEHKDQLENERMRHLDFLRTASDNELISESLDLLISYQNRFFEAVQQYLGRVASYESQAANERLDEETIEEARMRKIEAAASCRGWVARLIALKEAYHEVISDDRAYNLTYDFSPKRDTNAYNLYRMSVQQAMNKIGRRLTRSVKTGKMDAERYRIPRPWLEEDQKESRKVANEMIDDFA